MTYITRPIPIHGLSEDGSLIAVSTTSSEDYPIGASVPIPPDKIIPIIFVPGIMGSNLKAIRAVAGADIKKDDPVWRPPNGAVNGLKEVGKWDSRGPAVRQQLLDPDNTDVDERGDIHLSGSTAETLHADAARKRGWGGVHLDSYGEILNFLDASMNQVYEHAGHDGGAPKPRVAWRKLIDVKKEDDPVTGQFLLTEGEVKHLADYHFPVYAMGYNWLQSNADSAKALSKKIEQIKTEWAKYHFKKVVIVTHSMGGLVARYCAKFLSADDILGVVHGVLPTVGAPAAYRRLACGAEKSSPSNNIFQDLLGALPVATIVGSQANRTTPVMGNACGPLELLPNHLYPKKWLIGEVADNTGKVRVTVKLPYGNPYADIYQNRDAWYRLVNPAFLDPKNTTGDAKLDSAATGQAWGKYLKRLSYAEKFHKKLDDFYFTKSYVYYGDDDKHLSFGTVRWRATTAGRMPTESQLETARITADRGEGERGAAVNVINPALFAPAEEFPLRFSIAAQDVAGDGAVPREAGAAPTTKDGVRFIIGMKGFDHQGSYKNKHAKDMLLYSICKLAQEAG